MRARDKKAPRVIAEILSFLDELSTRDDIWPAVGRRARQLAASYRQADKRGPGSNLKPGDRGRIVSFVNRKIAEGKLLPEAKECASERFRVSTQRITQIYKALSNTSI